MMLFIDDKDMIEIQRLLGVIEGAACGCENPMGGMISDAVSAIDDVLKEIEAHG